MTHTPGPWKKVYEPKSNSTFIVGGGEVYVATVEGMSAGPRHAFKAPGACAESNADLIAAAPRMLQALLAYVDRCPMCNADMECQDNLCGQYRAIILDARGEL